MSLDLFARELKLRAEAGRVMQELRERGDDWQTAWKTHPVAIAYRKLLQEAWRRPVENGYPMPKPSAAEKDHGQ
jgi:hypothetical protein